MSDRLIRSNVVLEMCGGIHAATLKRWINEKGFPQPRMVLGRMRMWREGDVVAWLEAQK